MIEANCHPASWSLVPSVDCAQKTHHIDAHHSCHQSPLGQPPPSDAWLHDSPTTALGESTLDTVCRRSAANTCCPLAGRACEPALPPQPKIQTLRRRRTQERSLCRWPWTGARSPQPHRWTPFTILCTTLPASVHSGRARRSQVLQDSASVWPSPGLLQGVRWHQSRLQPNCTIPGHRRRATGPTRSCVCWLGALRPPCSLQAREPQLHLQNVVLNHLTLTSGCSCSRPSLTFRPSCMGLVPGLRTSCTPCATQTPARRVAAAGGSSSV